MSGPPSSPTGAEHLRAYVLIAMRDVLPPLIGAFLAVYLPITHQFEWWQAPLIAGAFGIPLTAPRKPKDLE